MYSKRERAITMKRKSLIHIIFVTVILQIMICGPLYAVDDLTPGNSIPKFEMNAPENPEQCKYLGIEGKKKFTLQNISSKLIIVEFFNVFCPKCHAQAPKINQIYAFIEGDKELKQNIKMFAIGLLSKPDQLDAYKKKFDILFPLIPDENGQLVQTLNISAIPQILILDQKGKVLGNHTGLMDDVDAFMLETRKLLKQQ
jgi:thiol-disulfide isomerase/thioredoxin